MTSIFEILLLPEFFSVKIVKMTPIIVIFFILAIPQIFDILKRDHPSIRGPAVWILDMLLTI